MADDARSRLGRGLASLIGDVGGEAKHQDRPRTQRKVPTEFLKPNPRNPRRAFSDAELGELADSIRQHGVIQPIVVRPIKGAQDRFEIIAGERRWRASQIIGLHEVPIVPVEVSDSDALEIAIIENVQREDLNAMEEAQGYHALADEFKRSQEDIAKIVGKSRSHVANMMRLTKLPAEVQAYIAAGQLSAGHARALIGVPDPRKGEHPLAFVAGKEGVHLEEKALLQFIREKLADYKVPRRVVFMPALPRNATGKVLKTSLRQQL